MLESRSFDICINTAALIIAMLGCSEISTEISDTSIETAKPNNYREILWANRNTNSVLTIIWEGARFSYKDGWKFINLFTQSISGLC